MKLIRRSMVAAAAVTLSAPLWSTPVLAQGAPLKFGVGMFQPDREKNDATYRPLAQHLSARLGRPVELRTVDSWEGLAKSLANGETDIALMGPWAMSWPITSPTRRWSPPSSTRASPNTSP